MPENVVNNAASYGSYTEYFGALRNLAARYGSLPTDSVFNAWLRATTAVNPFIQNQRVKSISTMPGDYRKDQIVDMLKAPDNREEPLRQVAHGLEWTAYPYRKIRTTYQAVNTYRYYHYPAYLEPEDAGKPEFWREGTLLDKFNHALRPDQWAHQIVGQVVQEGKAAYVPRFEADKSHNAVNYAMLQQLPSNWWKLVGFNSESKYTVMFNMMYFLQPGSDWRQFGSLFLPYLEDFNRVLRPSVGLIPAKGNGKRFVYASKSELRSADGRAFDVDLKAYAALRDGAAGDPLLYNQNGTWAYWVTLPVDKCWVFEADDTSRVVAPPFAGLFLAFDQLSALEDVQMAILQNPLVQILVGEVPYWSEKQVDAADQYKLSPTARDFFIMEWYNMLSQANTGGIGFFPAPLENMHMESLQEAPNATNISTTGYAYAIQKAGLSGLIPINSDPRAGAVNLSATLEERAMISVYWQMRNMMESLYRQIGTKWEWRFAMFGGFLSDDKDLEDARKGMSSGILSETLRYLALRGVSVWEDLSISRMIKASGVLDLRLPLVSSYNMKQDTSGLPPQPDNQGGRPEKTAEDVAGGNVGESYEGDADSMG